MVLGIAGEGQGGIVSKNDPEDMALPSVKSHQKLLHRRRLLVGEELVDRGGI